MPLENSFIVPHFAFDYGKFLSLRKENTWDQLPLPVILSTGPFPPTRTKLWCLCPVAASSSEGYRYDVLVWILN